MNPNQTPLLQAACQKAYGCQCSNCTRPVTRTLSEILQYNEMSHALRERLKLLLNSLEASQTKPQSDEGLREALEKIQAELLGDSKDFLRISRCQVLCRDALARQAPVPTPSDEALAREIFRTTPIDGDHEEEVKRLSALLASHRQGAVPVPTSGVVEIITTVLAECMEEGIAFKFDRNKAAAIIQQYGEHCYAMGEKSIVPGAGATNSPKVSDEAAEYFRQARGYMNHGNIPAANDYFTKAFSALTQPPAADGNLTLPEGVSAETAREVEARSIERFEGESLGMTGNKWDWSKASVEVQNRYRLKTFLFMLPSLAQPASGGGAI